MTPEPVALIGLGPIGQAVLRLVAARPALRVVAAVDADPAKIGRDAGELVGLPGLAVPIEPRLEPSRGARLAFLCTGSQLDKVTPHLLDLIAAGVSVVSTCEELAYAEAASPDLAPRIDAAARAAGVGVVATGVNPGFAMDALPLLASTACAEVRALRVLRVQDAALRRLPFQEKIGAGLSVAQAEDRIRAGTLGHVGFRQSLAMIAARFGWQVERVEETITPQIASTEVGSAALRVGAGRVTGIIQEARGFVGGEARLLLRLEAYLGAKENYDAIELDGTPDVRLRCAGGFPGDTVTAAVAVNAVASLLAAPPGLHSMASLPLPSFWTALPERSPA